MRTLQQREDIEDHLAAALNYQVGYLTSATFRQRAEQRLSDLKPTRR